ncbi:MAG: tRNA threonylcarbamoyladenosine dehydratase [Lachnospiraceae bacterium]
MNERLIRTGLLLGEAGLERLAQARIAVFGIGGVGGFAVEALARSGVGHLSLIDKDVISESNINRQIIATTKTIGQKKVQVMEKRIKEINPEAQVLTYDCFFLPETAGQFSFKDYDYIIDAVDTVSAKIELAMRAHQAEVPLISCMGAGNKLDPTAFEVADLAKTSVCPLARVMRRELKKRGIEHLKVVYSREEVIKTPAVIDEESGKMIPGSIAFVPSAAGLILAGEVIKDLTIRE